MEGDDLNLGQPDPHQEECTGSKFGSPQDGDCHQDAVGEEAEGCDFHVCAIGASAGGLEALREFFAAIPVDLGVVYVVIQHLSPEYESKMPELLRRVTELPIAIVGENDEGTEVCPDHVYLIPPAKEMAIQNGRLFLADRESNEHLALPIDHFFLSLANDQGRFSIAVILSGTGGDGSRSLGDVHRAGGLVLVQDPPTAKFSSMPETALATGFCDVIAPPSGLADAIVRYVRESLSREQVEALELSTGTDAVTADILKLLEQDTDIDFGIYKPKGVKRRIERRLELAKRTSIEAYSQLLHEDKQERQRLVSDLLIGVTEFFRDPKAFDVLQHEAVSKIINSKKDGDEIRVWVAGCATGEEAYSLTFMVSEAIRRAGKRLHLKLFASDVHRAAVDAAAIGIYSSNSVELLPSEIRENYFTRVQAGFQVNARVRQQIVFVCHNLMEDAPFTRMDLVSCRNLLIYLQPPAQQKVLALFHFSLRPSGFLFLGKSESLGDLEDEFETIDVSQKIFRKLRDVQLATLRAEATRRSAQAANVSDRVVTANHGVPRLNDKRLQVAYDMLLSESVPIGFLVSHEGQLIHTFGRGGEMLRISSGRYSDQLTEIIHPDLKPSLGAALQHSLRGRKPVEYRGIRIPNDLKQSEDGNELVLTVRPLPVTDGDSVILLVAFRLDTNSERKAEGLELIDVSDQDQGTIATLQRELNYTKENLQATIEELEASNEELQATNEEMTASNEELQSTNEELQSVNEELHTVNAEYHRKIAQLQEANDDMDNLLTSSEVAVLFLDHRLQVRRFTPKLGFLLGLRKQDVGREVEAFQSPFLTQELLNNLQEVLSSRKPLEHELSLSDDRAFLVHVTPFTSTTIADGVVLTYSEVTAIRKREDAERRWASIVESTSDCIIAMDFGGRVTQWNKAAEELYGHTSEESQGKNFFDLVVPREHREQMASRLEQVRSDKVSAQFDSQRVAKSGKRIDVSVRLSPLTGIHGSVGVSSIERDVTRSHRLSKLRELEESVRADALDIGSGSTGLDVLARDIETTLTPAGFSIWRVEADQSELKTVVDRWNDDGTSVLDQHQLELDALRDKCFETGERVMRTFESAAVDGQANSWLLTFKPLVGKTRTVGVLAMLLRGVDREEMQEIRTTLRRIASLLAIRIEDEEHVESLIRVSEIVKNSSDFIGSTDATGKVVSLNRAGRLLMGIGLDEDVARLRINDFHPDDTTQHLLSVALPETRRVGHWSGESVLRDREGTEFPVSQLIICHRSHDGEVRYFSTICRVISEQKDVQLRLEQLINETRESNDTRSRFVANISHDVRTPMTSVIGMADLLLLEDLDPSHRDMIDAIRDNGVHVTELLNDLLDLSRADAGEMNIRPTAVELHLLFDEMVAANAPLFEKGSVEFRFKIEIAESSKALIDRTRLRQIVENLISNARKFTVNGSVTLEATYSEETLVVVVHDTGCGIEESLLLSVFDPYKQVDPVTGPRMRGAGLGLAISRKLATAMGGSLTATSQPNQGSAFTLTVPARFISDDDHGETDDSNDSQVDSQAALLGKRILVAEDTRAIQFVVRRILEKHGIEVTVVGDGAQAVDAINEKQQSPFELVLLDMQMPVLDGYETARSLRDAGITIPIIAMTASTMPDEQQAALNSGCDSFIAKPIDQKKLVATLLDSFK